jgi:hypothetical protein
MKCPNCQQENPEGKKFCGDCGSDLSSPRAVSGPPVPTDLQSVIQQVVNERLKDQKVIEVEAAEGIVNRLITWFKIFGLATSIPLAILGVILAVVGISKMSDFYQYVDDSKHALEKMVSGIVSDMEKSKNDLDQLVAATEKNIKVVGSEATKRSDDTQKLKDRLHESEKTFAEKIGELQGAVNQLQKTEFEPSAGLTPELQRSLESDLARFQN